MEFFNILDSMFDEFEEYRDIQKGKGIRGKLITIINPEAQKLAALVEAIHLASLLHDDVIDEADTRRGVQSINAKYGDHTAVMLGDIVYSRAFYELIDFGSEIAKTISNAVYLLSQGELEDVKLSKNLNLNKEKYMQMIYKKTASLIEAACKASAISKGYDKDDFALYGKNIGIAFQIVDDLLDITQDSETLGKPAMHDYFEGKTTLPFIYLFESANEEEKEKLKSLYKKRLSDEEVEWIRALMQKYGIIKRCFDEAKELVDEAKNVIKKYEIPALMIIADKVVDRKF
ncbi:polyprenyl synthetase family protein [Caminibacter pacificus]|uniref:Octaprenyl-diphosphate synthase n=1 Tax=Caminibacter pacificus TaxID=1424653 RepID=A0AAJ4RE23_9BACT|nr:polyprenyl synthetase family protein [Caminibacter pacificus]QCI28385.1 polyprenyl synthetase family protein [Caminibacter pacificus]ROR40891.1 octaprenyl-diphosphate synthase [Caminibacter pacificus]